MRAYSEDLRKKALILLERGKTKAEVVELLDIGIATLYRWIKKKAKGESLKPSKGRKFIRKIDPEVVKQYVREHPEATLKEMNRDLGFGTTSIWYRLQQLKITLKKGHYAIRNAMNKTGKSLGKELAV